MIIYTDGSCKQSKKGAYGFLTVIDEEINMCFVNKVDKTTNNKMELMALKSALHYIKKANLKKVTIYSDSKYTVDGFTHWMFKWQNDRWKTSKNKQVLNKKIWEKLIVIQDELKRLGINVEVKWVKAHSSNKYNNYIDKIVQNLIK